ncbi:hypothetical protein ACQ7DA_13305 [Zafaria sp. J156]|uniref:hypothetical protein n=1 Tax=Actinomycetes TaxID=1760 RepID=UPI0005ED38B2|nr:MULTISPECIES: hypothetical protein [Actinomycetes]MDI9960425.1 hypothetical protein [Rhodococcus sp. IEGM 1237]MDI9966324.1 hypothetical protein [Rhodococcus sp. IEGM 1251]MDV8128660.1 hypothetical protein [Rhodococcus sp. IEGM 1304]MEE1622141.1 hypothetical protein [Zafaria sp. J156]
MSERDDLVGALDRAGVLAGIRWAFLSAADRVLEDYSEAAGHDATWVGVTRFTLFRDRLDRVFSCRRYAVAEGTDGQTSLDLLHAELTERDITTLPALDPELVGRADLSGSPGWSHEGTRWLLASSAFGKLDEVPWPQKSTTKQRVAQQPTDEPDPPTLFDHFTSDEQAGLATLMAGSKLDLHTLVVGHSLDAERGGRELVIGQPRLNSGGGSAWYWKHDLLQTPPADGGRLRPSAPMPVSPDTTPDAPVKLRRPAAEQPNHGQVGQ